MAGRRKAISKGAGGTSSAGRDKFCARVDSTVLASVRSLAKRKRALISEMTERALRQLIEEDTSALTDATMAPLIDRVLATRLKTLEGGLRSMIARLAYENLTLQYIVLHFLVEANIPPSKVERWRTEGRKFAIQEYRRKPDIDEGALEEEDED